MRGEAHRGWSRDVLKTVKAREATETENKPPALKVKEAVEDDLTEDIKTAARKIFGLHCYN